MLTRAQVSEIVERMLKSSGRRIDLSSPFVDAMLPEGHRLHVVLNHGTFGGAPGYGGICSNGGAPSGIGVTWVVLNSVISNNHAIGPAPTRPTRARQAVAAVAVSITTATVSGSSTAAP